MHPHPQPMLESLALTTAYGCGMDCERQAAGEVVLLYNSQSHHGVYVLWSYEPELQVFFSAPADQCQLK